MNNSEALSTIYKSNFSVINTNLEGISHEESLITKGTENSINWITGHILATRRSILRELGIEAKIEEVVSEVYRRGGENVKADNAVQLEDLLKQLSDTQEQILEALPNIDPDRIKKIAFFGFHEAYHCGQLGTMRKVIGKEGKIG